MSTLDSPRQWPRYLVERAVNAPPKDCFVVGGSTPVVAFGDPTRSRVATIGINPSCNEFLRKGLLMEGDKRRLATYESLRVSGFAELGSNRGVAILDDCKAYFQRRPYGWFKSLDQILAKGLSASYYDGTACHLDLVQWATDPFWSRLNSSAQLRLLNDGLPFLKELLSQESFELIVVNGRTVVEVVEQLGLTTWSLKGQLDGPPSVKLFLGTGSGTNWLGWSCNLQSQPGARKHIDALISFAKESILGPGSLD